VNIPIFKALDHAAAEPLALNGRQRLAHPPPEHVLLPLVRIVRGAGAQLPAKLIANVREVKGVLIGEAGEHSQGLVKVAAVLSGGNAVERRLAFWPEL
jgi:hypothetical protein